MAADGQRATVCVDQTTLATEIVEGAGKCMPAIAKTRENDRPVCGPERSWPPDRVTSRMTMAMAPVSADDLKARLCVFPPKQVEPNPTALRISRAAAHKKNNAVPIHAWVEPLVSQHFNSQCTY